MTLVKALIPWTVAIYLGFFLIYGLEVFDTDFDTSFEDESTFLDFLSTAFNVAGDIVQFITLGGATSPLPGLLQTILLLTIGVGWLIVALGLVRGTAAS